MAEAKSIPTSSELPGFIPWTANKVSNANSTDIKTYIDDRLIEYEDENLYGCELHGYFATDFQEFTTTAFKKTTESTKTLRDFLRKKNVFIQKNRGTQIASALIDTLQNPFSPMPDTMMNEVMGEYRPVHSFTASRSNKALQSHSLTTIFPL